MKYTFFHILNSIGTGDLGPEGLIFFSSTLITLCIPSCPQSDRKRVSVENNYSILIFGGEIVHFKCSIYYIYCPSKETGPFPDGKGGKGHPVSQGMGRRS